MPSIVSDRTGSNAPLKRSLRSNTLDVSITPVRRKSPRRSAASSPNNSLPAIKSESEEKSEQIGESPVKNLSDQLTGKLNCDSGDKSDSWYAGQVSAVKEALHVSTAPRNVVCREEEQSRILEFCKSCVEHDKPGSLYVCGCPGTGKSLSMERVKQQLVDWANKEGYQAPDVLTLNCTSLTKTSEIFNKIVGQIQLSKGGNGSTSPLQHLQNLYSQPKSASGLKMTLIIADELDYLITKDRVVLHDLFMLTTFPSSRCILIGIANAIDLADRFLPKLKSLNCKPAVITFRAYSKDQILRILQERLMTLPKAVFHPLALELCARKVAAASGDMRKALGVCRSAIEVLEAEMRECTSNSGSISPDDELLKQQRSQHCNVPENNTVKIDHMAIALSKAFRSPIVDTIQSLPQHQQIILCAAVKFFRGGKKDTTIGELNKFYVDVCKKMMIPPVGILEFLSMCRVLNDQGLLKLGQARDDKSKRVILRVDQADITFALQGVRFFRNCLQ